MPAQSDAQKDEEDKTRQEKTKDKTREDKDNTRGKDKTRESQHKRMRHKIRDTIRQHRKGDNTSQRRDKTRRRPRPTKLMIGQDKMVQDKTRQHLRRSGPWEGEVRKRGKRNDRYLHYGTPTARYIKARGNIWQPTSEKAREKITHGGRGNRGMLRLNCSTECGTTGKIAGFT